jgi:predicted Ser/Thr protein kinase/tetratricopeptide (TPR) repeat protein
MDPDLVALFRELADRPSAARDEYYARHRVSPALRAEVESLLRFDHEAVDPLRGYVASAANLLLHDTGAAADRVSPDIEFAGRRCGPYRLRQIIGRGGMGAVYLADRADDEVIQRVAVKLLPPGAGDAQRERFLQERQILATLTHPNIARLIDAGHVEHGQPFLAMEYVEGKPIDVFAAALNVRQKIGLFLKVCAAVAYLHRHLIVHRDLKPNNIFVAADGEPKLLDFGIAKLLDVATDTTVTSVRMLTPGYASPEQVMGGRITTTTDVYSLGAVLYLLLTGKPAHEFEGGTPESIASIVTREITRPSRWAPELKGDLEAILLKALRKDPQDRYETVGHLAEDLQAFLESRPVRARSGNAWYRARKVLRRYWVPAAAAAVVFVSLAAGLYVANRERTLAQRRFADVRQLANKLFDIDYEVRQLSGSARARQLIVDTSLEYLRRLTAEASEDPELALELATAYRLVAEAEGVTTGPNLGQLDAAERDLEIADQLVQSVLQSQPANRTAALRAAQIAASRMTVAWQRGDGERVLSFADQAATWLDTFQPSASDRQWAEQFLGIYVHVAHQYMLAERSADALHLCARGSDLALTFDRPLIRGNCLNIVALVLRDRGDLDGALNAARESVQLLEPGPADTGPAPALNFVLALVRAGWILGEDGGISLGRSEEAVALLDRAFRIADRFVHEDPSDESSRSRLYLAGGPMADILRHSDASRALAIYDHTLSDMNGVASDFLRTRAVNLLAGSSYALRALGRDAEAGTRLDRAFASLTELGLHPADTIEAASEAHRALSALADHEAETGNISAAIVRYDDLLRRLAAGSAKPEDSLYCATEFARLYQSLAALHRRNGRDDLASAIDARRLELWRHWDRKSPDNPFVRQQLAAPPAAFRGGR